jgi:hypothetical protein
VSIKVLAADVNDESTFEAVESALVGVVGMSRSHSALVDAWTEAASSSRPLLSSVRGRNELPELSLRLRIDITCNRRRGSHYTRSSPRT